MWQRVALLERVAGGDHVEDGDEDVDWDGDHVDRDDAEDDCDGGKLRCMWMIIIAGQLQHP